MGWRLLSVENYRFLKSFLSTPRLFWHLESAKQVGNSRNRTSETSPFQNFFPIQKILNIKKIRSIFVWIEVIFFWSSAYLTYIDYFRSFHHVGLGFEEACFNKREKREHWFSEGSKVIRTDRNRLQSFLRVDCGWIYAADGPTTPSELGDRLFSFGKCIFFSKIPDPRLGASWFQRRRGFGDAPAEKLYRA